MKFVLAIETSCDDTSVAVVQPDGRVLVCLAQNQDKAHAPYGGIVPEIAGRNHTDHVLPLVEQALAASRATPQDLLGVAVTNRPGLIGSLFVGIATAKSLAMSWELPWIGVNHLEGHLLAGFLQDDEYEPMFHWDQSYGALAVSGGHSTLYEVQSVPEYRVMGSTLDDAAGEAFDKFAKMLGLGFPGGAVVDKIARTGDRSRYEFPRGLAREENFNFSFSGLKSAAQRVFQGLAPEKINDELPHLCASFQEAVVDALMIKLERFRAKSRLQHYLITGGVSANSRLRERALEWGKTHGLAVMIPPLRYCTDNAAMIGLAGALRLARGERSSWQESASPASRSGDFL